MWLKNYFLVIYFNKKTSKHILFNIEIQMIMHFYKTRFMIC